jgi:hypothetical protein
VAAFLASGIATSAPDSIGEPYEDGTGTTYLRLLGQPLLIYGADRGELMRALDRALARGVRPAIYTAEMFAAGHDAANCAAVRAVERANLDLLGLAFRADRRVADTIVDTLKLHQ